MKSLISAFVISMFLVIGVYAGGSSAPTSQDSMMTTTRKPLVQIRHRRMARRHHRREMRRDRRTLRRDRRELRRDRRTWRRHHRRTM